MMLSTDTPLVDGPTTQDAIPVIERTSRNISQNVSCLHKNLQHKKITLIFNFRK